MRIPAVCELIRCWEQGLHRPLHQRALVMLAAACPDSTVDELARLSIGRRDALLLRMRSSIFGQQLTSQVDCANCGESLEATFRVADVLVDDSGLEVEPFAVTADDRQLVFRLPNSQDLEIALAEREEDLQRRALLRCCAVSMHCTSEGDDAPASVLDLVESRMAELDPQANVEIDLSCPQCQRRWSEPFDIASFLWSEISAWARRILQEVHLLARTYGWSEWEILEMHPTKRQIYLQMATP